MTDNKYPDGKLNENDEGEIETRIGVQDGKVIIEYSHSVKWVGFTPDGAIEFANVIIKRAMKIGVTKPVEIILPSNKH